MVLINYQFVILLKYSIMIINKVEKEFIKQFNNTETI